MTIPDSAHMLAATALMTALGATPEEADAAQKYLLATAVPSVPSQVVAVAQSALAAVRAETTTTEPGGP